MKSLSELKELCRKRGIQVNDVGRLSKEPYLNSLRLDLWEQEHPGVPLPEQIQPMLLFEWRDLDEAQSEVVEMDDSGWCIQEKKDGVRALMHITTEGVRITGRTFSELTFRLAEFQDNLPHLTRGFENLVGTVLDGELVCPADKINTGDTITSLALQATVAILAASSEKSNAIQNDQAARLQFHVFDVLRYQGQDVTTLQLSERLRILEAAVQQAQNEFIRLVPTFTAAKFMIHDTLIHDGHEGSVWKKLDQPYSAGKRVKHWIKRKRGIEVEAIVTGFKPGTPNRGNETLVGAVEFSIQEANGATRPIAWVCNWTDEERRLLTLPDENAVTLNPHYLGRVALIRGQDISAKAQRIRHATFVCWCPETNEPASTPFATPPNRPYTDTALAMTI